MNNAHAALIDRERGLSLAGHDAQLYDAFLAAFPQDTTFAAMLCALDAGDVRDAFLYAHSLKGLCAQLGLCALGEAASAVCELLRGGDEGNLPAARARAENVAALHEATCDAIRKGGTVSFH